MLVPALSRVARFERHVTNAVCGELAAGAARELGNDVDAIHVRGEARQERGHVTAAGADFEHAILGVERKLLQHPRLELRLEHALSMPERYLHVDKRECAIR